MQSIEFEAVLHRAVAVAHALADIADRHCKQADVQKKSNELDAVKKLGRAFVTPVNQRIECAQCEEFLDEWTAIVAAAKIYTVVFR